MRGASDDTRAGCVITDVTRIYPAGLPPRGTSEAPPGVRKPALSGDDDVPTADHLEPAARRRTAELRGNGIRQALVDAGIIVPRPSDYDEATAHQAAAEARLEARGVPTLRIDMRGRRSVRRPRLQWDPLVELGGAPEHHQRGAR